MALYKYVYYYYYYSSVKSPAVIDEIMKPWSVASALCLLYRVFTLPTG